MAAFCIRLLSFLALLALAPAGVAQAQLAMPDHNAIEARLLAESDRPAAGASVTLAIVMTPEKGWHGYWQNPGDAGVETRADWRLPAGVSVGPLQYPVPGKLLISGLMNYVYEGPYAILVPLKVPAGLAPDTRLPVSVKLDYLACTDRICVPERAELDLELAVGNGSEQPERRALFDAYRRMTPKPLGSPAAFDASGGKVRLSIPLPSDLALGDAYFFPLTTDAVAYAAPQSLSRSGDRLGVEVAAGPAAAKLGAINGVLKIGEGQGLLVRAERGTVPAHAAGSGDGNTTFFTALLGAMLGGLLLNILPCVFPILSLKALSLARAGGNEAEARHEALAYAIGVILTCLALGGILLGLRAAGVAAGWSFQLQDPRVILFLLLLVTVIALNLAGLFELPAITGGQRLAEKSGTAGAFWTGALAAFVATPCTGPFMGAALGAALVLPTVAGLAVFAGLGVGIALPFLLIGFIPPIRRLLPRPGPWMARFRRILSVPMFLTAAALLWVLARQSGSLGIVLAGLTAAIAGLALWRAGRRQAQGVRPWLALVPAAIAAMAALLLIPSVHKAPIASSDAILGAEPFSEAKLASLRAARRPVFVYFTADWCVTCKVNERAVLARDQVAQAFAAHDVAVLVGDWTTGDPAITRFLEANGRSGVPFYLFYAPGQPAQGLPQLLTVSDLTGLVES